MSSKNRLGADNQQATRRIISDEYLAGFTDGEGCFYIGFSKREDLPLKWQIITEFHLSQNPGGKNLLEVFCKRLQCGYIKLNHAKSLKDKSYVLIIKDRKDLREKLIPFFKKNPLRTAKQQDFVVFAKVLEVIEQNKHLQKKGFNKIVKLVFANKRSTNKRYSEKELLI
jgi:hypothetical protein